RHTPLTRSRASNCCSGELSPLGSQSLASLTSTALVRVVRQNCRRRLRQWSFCRLMAMRISQVSTDDSARKPAQLRCAFKKQSWVSVSARSTSCVDASRNRKICGLCVATTSEKSASASSEPASRVAVCIVMGAIPAAITQVDGRAAGKFTARDLQLEGKTGFKQSEAEMEGRGEAVASFDKATCFPC